MMASSEKLRGPDYYFGIFKRSYVVPHLYNAAQNIWHKVKKYSKIFSKIFFYSLHFQWLFNFLEKVRILAQKC